MALISSTGLWSITFHSKQDDVAGAANDFLEMVGSCYKLFPIFYNFDKYRNQLPCINMIIILVFHLYIHLYFLHKLNA